MNKPMISHNTNGKPLFTCPHCGQQFGLTPPKPEEPLNTLRTSVVVIPHEKPIKCQNAKCAKTFVWVVSEASLKWTILAISDEQAATLDGDRIVVASPLSLVAGH